MTFPRSFLPAACRAVPLSALALVLLLPSSVMAQHSPASAPESDPPLPARVSTAAEQATDLDSRFVVDRVTGTAADMARGRLLEAVSGSGSGNAAQITQQGNGNVTLFRQLGMQNAASLQVYGDNNRIEALQAGAANQLGVSLTGSNNEVPVLQVGTNLQMQLRLQGVDGMTLPVRQTGSGIPMTIEMTPGSPRR